MHGSCLCGEIKFALKVDTLKMYQCHCLQCRKQTGTASNCGAVVHLDQFRWLCDPHSIRTWEKPTGFSSHFCATCGASVPNQFRAQPYYFVPVGLLDEDAVHIETVANLFTQEQVRWSNVDARTGAFETCPEIATLLHLLQVHQG